MAEKWSDELNEGSLSPTRRTETRKAVRNALEMLEKPEEPEKPESQLFTSFVSLASTLAPGKLFNSELNEFVNQLQLKNIGIFNTHLNLLGYGSSFSVFVIPKDEQYPGWDTIVMKRTIPTLEIQSQEKIENRINDMMLELRVLCHDPIQKHDNIVNLLGVAWETDPVNFERHWPVLLIERATLGTLSEFLQQQDSFAFGEKLALSMDVVLALEVLHQCGILHGDIKLDNVLVFENSNPQTCRVRPFVAKLADFGGALFDIDTVTTLPAGTLPWTAPELLGQGASKNLTPESLLQTDVYSLGFLIWRLFANGMHLFLKCSSSASKWKEAEEMKKNDTKLFNYLDSIEGFEPDVDRNLLNTIIKLTVRVDSAARSLEAVKSIIQEILKVPRDPPDFAGLPEHQRILRDKYLPFSFVDINKLDTPVSRFVFEELIRTVKGFRKSDETSEAAYGLAVLLINRNNSEKDRDEAQKDGLIWLEIAAWWGSDRAQALLYRMYEAFEQEIPESYDIHINTWLHNTGSRGFFHALEDLSERGLPETLRKAKAILAHRYAGTGDHRYNKLGFTPGFPSNVHELDANFCEDAKQNGNVKALKFGIRGDRVLHFAASCGLKETADYLIKEKVLDLDSTNIIGETALLLACRSGHFQISMQLLNAGANPKIANDFGDTPLHWLLSFDKENVAEVGRKLHEAKPDLDAVASRWAYIHCGENAFVQGTPLMRAIARNRLDVVDLLLELGADPNFVENGASAVSLAAQLHYPHTLKSLLAKSRDRPVTVDKLTGQSLLVYAICGGSCEAQGTFFGRIQRHGRYWSAHALETLQVLLDHGAKEHLHALPGYACTTAIAVAAFMAGPDIVKFLLENGCVESINKPSMLSTGPEYLYTPLIASILSRNSDVFHLLLEYGADAKASHKINEQISVTTLYECARSSIDIVEFAQALIDRGVGIDETPRDYETPLGCALRQRCFELTKYLVKSGANINAEYKNGLYVERTSSRTILGYLIEECSIGALVCIKFLMRPNKQALDFIVSKSTKLSALHAVAIIPHAKQDNRASAIILDCLLSHFKPEQSQLNMRFSSNNYTALHIAALNANYAVTWGLLKAGADPLLKDADDFTALDLARCADHSKLDSFVLETPTLRTKLFKLVKSRAKAVVELLENNSNGK